MCAWDRAERLLTKQLAGQTIRKTPLVEIPKKSEDFRYLTDA
jgi:hypothetical protein